MALTEKQKTAMARGRQVHLETQRKGNRAEWVRFLKWVREDRRLNEALRLAHEGGTRAEVDRARAAVRANLKSLAIPSGPRPEDV